MACLVLPTLAAAQGIITGSATGTVQDSSGAIVTGADITALNTTTGVSAGQDSAWAGNFNFFALPIGTYQVTITGSGFASLKLDNVTIESGKATGLGIQKLGVGAAAVTIEVRIAQDLLETTQSQVTTTFDTVAVEDLPTGGGFDELALLVPGVASVHADRHANSNGATFSSNGQRDRANNFEIDGQSNNDNSVTGPQAFRTAERSV